jgi:uncharacterized protein YecA (UPF0149 family)
MDHFRKIDSKIQHGYVLILEDQLIEGCDEWLDAWEGIKMLMLESGAKDIFELEEKYGWTSSVSTYSQDLKSELNGAGKHDRLYKAKRTKYCEELQSYSSEEELSKRARQNSEIETYPQINDLIKSGLLDETWLRNTAAQETAVSLKFGRNKPCPCGSGKKHKKCCGA